MLVRQLFDLNVKKTRELLIDSRKHTLAVPPITIDSENVERVDKYIYHGIILQGKLKVGSNVLNNHSKMSMQNTIYPAIRGGYVPSRPANTENPRIIYAVFKRLFMILYALKYAYKAHSKDSLTHQYSNNVVICCNDK